MSFAVLLLVFNALIFQERTFELSTLEWAAVLVGYLGIANLNIPVPHWTGFFLKAGIAGILSSMLMGTLDQDLPVSIVLYGAGSGTLSYLCALIFLHFMRQQGNLTPSLAAVVAGLLGAWWTFGLPYVVEVEWIAREIEVLIPLTLILLVIAVMLSTYEFYDIGFVPSVGLIIVALILQMIGGVLTVGGLAIGLIIVIMLGLMLWYTIMNSPPAALSPDRVFHQSLTRGFLLSVLVVIGFAVGWVLRDLAVAGVVIVGGFGLLWLPFVSSLLGFRAFVALADEEII